MEQTNNTKKEDPSPLIIRLGNYAIFTKVIQEALYNLEAIDAGFFFSVVSDDITTTVKLITEGQTVHEVKTNYITELQDKVATLRDEAHNREDFIKKLQTKLSAFTKLEVGGPDEIVQLQKANEMLAETIHEKDKLIEDLNKNLVEMSMRKPLEKQKEIEDLTKALEVADKRIRWDEATIMCLREKIEKNDLDKMAKKIEDLQIENQDLVMKIKEVRSLADYIEDRSMEIQSTCSDTITSHNKNVVKGRPQ